jgi:acetyl-CoA carboxylase biotin carboxyl carrier protein
MADENNLEELRELVDFLKANGIAEFEMDRGEWKVRIKFEGAAAPPAGGLTPAQIALLMAGGGFPAPFAAGGSPAAAAGPGPASAGAAAPADEEDLHEVKSPIVGTFYESPSPGAAPFVKVGDTVEAGDTLCIVEAMKLMNEIESDVTGEIVKRIASSGQPVEYGQPLFLIRAREERRKSN